MRKENRIRVINHVIFYGMKEKLVFSTVIPQQCRSRRILWLNLTSLVLWKWYIEGGSFFCYDVKLKPLCNLTASLTSWLDLSRLKTIMERKKEVEKKEGEKDAITEIILDVADFQGRIKPYLELLLPYDCKIKLNCNHQYFQKVLSELSSEEEKARIERIEVADFRGYLRRENFPQKPLLLKDILKMEEQSESGTRRIGLIFDPEFISDKEKLREYLREKYYYTK
ncbi:MAG: hypothetical protein LBO09_06395 [Candidatus Peribacteria bacterium]|jgi:hypothetical protein|nr:hypothetical protein [Candidatus Peribacteria bacterium]